MTQLLVRFRFPFLPHGIAISLVEFGLVGSSLVSRGRNGKEVEFVLHWMLAKGDSSPG